MADVRRRAPKHGFRKAIWSLVGILSIGVAVRLAGPPAAAVLASALPRLWAVICSWLVPPYLFVHLIVLVIWKLSDQKQQQQQQQGDPWAVEERPPEAVGVIKVETFEPPPSSPLPRKPSPTTAIHPVADTVKESEEKTAASGVETLTESEADQSTVENESMETTWKAITENSFQGRAKLAEQEQELPELVAVRAREPSVTCRDELNLRFDEFIKKNYDQIRYQRQESTKSFSSGY